MADTSSERLEKIRTGYADGWFKNQPAIGDLLAMIEERDGRRCGTCRWWERWTAEAVYGECGAIRVDTGLAMLSAARNDEPLSLDTHEAFGCVQWEARGENG
jgi:hypothetical protein